MPQFLISTQDGKIRSVHNSPLGFSVAGRYVINVPEQLVVEAPTDSVPALVAAKVTAFKTQLPGLYFPFALFDELLDMSNVDLTLSYRYFAGRNKRAALFPGGSFITQALPVGVTTSRIYSHWNSFTLYSDPGTQPPDPVSPTPAPPRLLYNYDPTLPGFYTPNPNDFSVFLLDEGSRTTVTGVISDTLITVASVAGMPSIGDAGPDFDIFVTDLFGNDFLLTVDVSAYNPGSPLQLPVVSGGNSLTAGNSVWWTPAELSPDSTQLLTYGPGNVRLRFRNVSTSVRHLSDWILMHNDASGAPTLGIFDLTFDETFD